MMTNLVLPLFLALLPSCQAIISSPYRVSDILSRIVPQDTILQQKQVDDDVETLFFNQRLDHFSNDTVTTFKQRFFYSSRYASSSSGDTRAIRKNKKFAAAPLAFLCVGGEGPDMDNSVLIDSVHCTGDMIGLAEKLYVEYGREVHLFALEHRYYGESFPSETAVDYRYLSSRQAVRDIATFVQSVEVQQLINRITHDNHDASWERSTAAAETTTWVTFGGSYPGMLAAWSRLLHPESIFAAVSNSAPIQAQLEFPEYYERVGYDLENEDVGGSAVCRYIVEEGHAQVVAILEGRGRGGGGVGNGNEDVDSESDELDHVATLFNVCGGSELLRVSRRNRESFVGDGLIEIPAQSNNPHCKGDLCNIEQLCNAIVNERRLHPTKPSLEILAHISMLQNNITCHSVDWNDFLDYYSTPSKQNANDRSWLYQTCTEFGFYTTCNANSKCPFGQGYHDVARDFELCQVLFGIDPDTVKQNVDSTLVYYGGWNLTPETGDGEIPRGGNNDGRKRIIFMNGDADPWTALSLTDGNEDHPSFLVQGASHHFWTHSVEVDDGVFVVNARRTIYSIVSDWLGMSMLDTTEMGNWGRVSVIQ